MLGLVALDNKFDWDHAEDTESEGLQFPCAGSQVSGVLLWICKIPEEQSPGSADAIRLKDVLL